MEIDDEADTPVVLGLTRNIYGYGGWIDCAENACWLELNLGWTYPMPDGSTLGGDIPAARALVEIPTSWPTTRPSIAIVEPGPYTAGQQVTVEVRNHPLQTGGLAIGWCPGGDGFCGNEFSTYDNGIHRVTWRIPTNADECGTSRCYFDIGSPSEGLAPPAIVIVPGRELDQVRQFRRGDRVDERLLDGRAGRPPQPGSACGSGIAGEGLDAADAVDDMVEQRLPIRRSGTLLVEPQFQFEHSALAIDFDDEALHAAPGQEHRPVAGCARFTDIGSQRLVGRELVERNGGPVDTDLDTAAAVEQQRARAVREGVGEVGREREVEQRIDHVEVDDDAIGVAVVVRGRAVVVRGGAVGRVAVVKLATSSVLRVVETAGSSPVLGSASLVSSLLLHADRVSTKVNTTTAGRLLRINDIKGLLIALRAEPSTRS